MGLCASFALTAALIHLFLNLIEASPHNILQHNVPQPTVRPMFENRLRADGYNVYKNPTQLRTAIRQVTVPGPSNLPQVDGARPSRLFYSASKEAWVYINGKLVSDLDDPSQFKCVTGNLKTGDVIAIKVKGGSGFTGVIASLFYHAQLHVTGRENWRAVKMFSIPGNANAWLEPSYTACSWPKAIARPIAGIWNPGKSTYFPYNTLATYVWASNAGPDDTIFLRYRIGGEVCLPPLNTVSFHAIHSSWLFINGRQIRDDHDKRIHIHSHTFKKGDVIAIKASNKGGLYGVIAWVHANMGKYATAVDDWKAVKMFTTNMEWTRQSYDSCRWPKAVNSPRDRSPPGTGSSALGPYAFGAKYVWARGAASGDTIFLRLVIGGETCGPETGTIHVEAGRHAWVYHNGVHLGDIHTHSKSHRAIVKSRTFKTGDVIAIKVNNLFGLQNRDYASHPHRFYGMAAWIQTMTKTYATGMQDWKAIKMYPGSGRFLYSSFSSCSWPRAQILSNVRSTGTSAAVAALKGGAKYVWAKDAGELDLVLFRFVVGGEAC